MTIALGAAVPGPAPRTRQITNTETMEIVHSTRMRSLQSSVGNLRGQFNAPAVMPAVSSLNFSRLFTAGEHDAGAVAHMPERLGVSTQMSNHRDRAGRPDLVTPAGRRWSEENAECAARRPVAEGARLHGLLAQFLGVADRDLKENLLADIHFCRPSGIPRRSRWRRREYHRERRVE